MVNLEFVLPYNSCVSRRRPAWFRLGHLGNREPKEGTCSHTLLTGWVLPLALSELSRRGVIRWWWGVVVRRGGVVVVVVSGGGSGEWGWCW